MRALLWYKDKAERYPVAVLGSTILIPWALLFWWMSH